ncbi:exodeoxyribonuclease VII large subunit [Tannockella kyphosi]|uniref:exodeoxyribonuclease VII large subunit n=1 Tax=Tannockella kyphosi TaxID=2899121 RepID=UPI002010F397|nr:exodeoxyribonuclease VII large subunit [Tannockella kyphosi]
MERQYLTVASLNRYIGSVIDKDTHLQKVYIKGEISNVKHHSSGHLYFTLKDDNSRINAVMFSYNFKSLAFEAKEGLKVLIEGSVSVYDAGGTYSIRVNTMELDGVGNLFLQFEQLKKDLLKEGLFDQANKKDIPKFPRSIAILTAYPSAALMDIMRVIRQRYPVVKVIIFPIPVQGKGAYVTISNKLKEVDQYGFSTILLARGGGSIEDLWNFNEEQLARTIFACKTPIINAVGHEIDVTICDYVADARGLTPTAGATLACPDLMELKQSANILERRLHEILLHQVQMNRQKLDALSNFYLFKNPEKLVTNYQLRLAHTQDNMKYIFDNKIINTKVNFEKTSQQFHHLSKLFLINTSQHINSLEQSLHHQMNTRLLNNQNRWNKSVAMLDALSPLKVMQRGYSITYINDKVITSSKDINNNDLLKVQYHDGIVYALAKREES